MYSLPPNMSESDMGPAPAETLERIIKAQQAIGGRVVFDRQHGPYLHRVIGGKELFIRWEHGDVYCLRQEVGAVEKTAKMYGTIKELKAGIEAAFADELKAANAIGR